MHCRPNVLPAIVCPTKCNVTNTFQNNIVPVIHPSHTTNINHINYQYQHHFPHTQSNVNEVTHQNFYAGSGPTPTPFGAGPFGPRPFFGR